jgi:hypothetical protein
VFHPRGKNRVRLVPLNTEGRGSVPLTSFSLWLERAPLQENTQALLRDTTWKDSNLHSSPWRGDALPIKLQIKNGKQNLSLPHLVLSRFPMSRKGKQADFVSQGWPYRAFLVLSQKRLVPGRLRLATPASLS